MVDQRRARGALALEPGELVGDGVDFFEDDTRAPPELERPAFVADWKASDRDGVDAFDAFGQLVTPRDVVPRAGRQDFDVGVARKPLGNVAGVQLGPAVDVGAVR